MKMSFGFHFMINFGNRVSMASSLKKKKKTFKAK